MSCRSTAAGSAFTTYARLTAGNATDISTLSAFHALRSAYNHTQPANRPPVLPTVYRGILERQRDQILADTTITEARRASLVARLDLADTQPEPDASTQYALANIQTTMRTQSNARNAFLSLIANQTGTPEADLRAQFNTLEDSIDRGRSAPRHPDVTPENAAAAHAAGLGREPGTIHAYAQLTAAASAAHAARTRTPRISLTACPEAALVRERVAPYVLAAGVDPRNGHAEMIIRDPATQTNTRVAYRNVDAALFLQRTSSLRGATSYWETALRGNTNHTYASRADRDAASVAPQCEKCGQFANNKHTCPQDVAAASVAAATPPTTSAPVAPVEPIAPITPVAPVVIRARDYNRGGGTWELHNVEVGAVGNQAWVNLPAVAPLRRLLTTGPVQIDYTEIVNSGEQDTPGAEVSGSFTVTQHGRLLTFNTDRLRCECGRFAENGGYCGHTQMLLTATQRFVVIPTPAEEAIERAARRLAGIAELQAEMDKLAAANWAANAATYAEAQKHWIAESEINYSENFAEFETVYNNALQARADNNDAPALAYRTENALGGYASPGTDEYFGFEIEYDFPRIMTDSEKMKAKKLIAKELHAEGLAREPFHEEYGSAKRRGFKTTQFDDQNLSNWTAENDISVPTGGEIISTGVQDTEETWKQLKTIERILQTHGAVSNKSAGFHVHAGAPFLQGDPKAYTELVRFENQHEDISRRISTDPRRKSHRGNKYSGPMPSVPPTGFTAIQTRNLRRWQGDRYVNLNFAGMDPENPASDHPEFRDGDSTSSAAAMQGMIMVAGAKIRAAKRIADNGGTQRPTEPIGAHHARAQKRGTGPMTSEELAEDTLSFRSFLDTLFVSKAEKDQIITQFAQTNWSEGFRREH